MTPLWFIAALVLAAVVVLRNRYVAARRLEYIRSFALPRGLFERVQKRRPSLTRKDCELLAQGLRQFFLAYAMSGHRFVSMPSQAVDDLWHEFILYTKTYQAFCRKAFGRFLHHTPAVVLGKEYQGNAGLRRCWWYACRIENINPRQPSRLPLLFALDAKLGIPDGFRYVPDCQSVRRQGDDGGTVYCGGDFGSSSVDGSVEGFGGGEGGSAYSGSSGDSFSSDGFGGGGGDSGGGCGGGCGGGD